MFWGLGLHPVIKSMFIRLHNLQALLAKLQIKAVARGAKLHDMRPDWRSKLGGSLNEIKSL
jgi:hypothetical protein